MANRAREILSGCGFFSDVRGEALDRLVAMAQLKRYDKGETIFRQDDLCPGLFIVDTGSVRIFKLAPSGKEHVLHIAGPGETFAEVAVIGRFAAPACAEAVTDTTALLLPNDSLTRELDNNHTLCLQLMASMARWVRQFVALMEDIVLRDAAGRLARHLLEASAGDAESFTLPNLKKDLASHLNLTGETLSRTLRRLADAGLIEQLEGQRMRIIRRDELQDLADGLYPMI
jgi:CRP/FNR family transcriptional regulator